MGSGVKFVDGFEKAAEIVGGVRSVRIVVDLI